VFLQNYQRWRIFRINELFFYSKIGGIGPRPVDRVHGGWCTGPWDLLNGDHWRPDPRQGFNQAKGYSAIQSWLSARDRTAAAASSLTLQRGRDRGGQTPWSLAWPSSSSSHGAPNVMRFDTTRSKRQGEPILQAYGKENGRGRAGDGGTVRSTLGDGEDGLRRCSGFEKQLYSFALLPSSSSLGQLLRTSMNQAWAVAIFMR
jgi:hypothetical protein